MKGKWIVARRGGHGHREESDPQREASREIQRPILKAGVALIHKENDPDGEEYANERIAHDTVVICAHRAGQGQAREEMTADPQ
jgi:hypothetical protein